MTFTTDEKLKSFLDTNQGARERMCRAILATDKRFAEVTPRHPAGGPDGGQDIQAVFERSRSTVGAIGFVNGANDSKDQKQRIKRKFKSDVKNALEPSGARVFVFMTNLNLTLREKEEFAVYAVKNGFEHAEILDRERLRIALDQPSGFFIRFQYLSIPLSEAEQASFLAQYGEDIQAVVESGFQRVDDALARVTFLLESNELLGTLSVHFELDRIYSAEEIGHFRAFMLIFLKEISANVWSILFGASDLSNRMRTQGEAPFTDQIPGIRHGIGFGQWERKLDVAALRKEDAARGEENKEPIPSEADKDSGDTGAHQALPPFESPLGGGSSGGVEQARVISINYSKENFASIRFERGIAFRDLHEAMFMPMVNKSLAEKIKAVHIIVDGYKLDEIAIDQIHVDKSHFEFDLEHLFTEEELKDPWVRLRPARRASNFEFDFYRKTPLRLYSSPKAPHTVG